MSKSFIETYKATVKITMKTFCGACTNLFHFSQYTHTHKQYF